MFETRETLETLETSETLESLETSETCANCSRWVANPGYPLGRARDAWAVACRR
jgi:hypothetical protein